MDQTPQTALPAEIITQAVQSFQLDATDAYIAEMKTAAAELSIAGENDKVGYKLVDEARKEIKRRRLAISNREKSLLEIPKKFTLDVKNEAKRIVELLKPIEDDLAFKQKAIDDIKAEKERQAALRLSNRTAYFFQSGMLRDMDGTFIHPENNTVRISLQELKDFTDEEIETVKQQIETIAEAKRKAAEAAERAAAAERARQDIESAKNATQAEPSPKFQPQQNQPQPPQFPPNQRVSAKPDPMFIHPVQNTFQPQQPRQDQTGYVIGFEEAKRRVIEVLADPTPRKRSEFVELINNLKP